MYTRCVDLAKIRAAVAAVDPLLVKAADEVDVTLIRRTLAMSVRERLDVATRTTRALTRFRRRDTPPGR